MKWIRPLSLCLLASLVIASILPLALAQPPRDIPQTFTIAAPASLQSLSPDDSVVQMGTESLGGKLETVEQHQRLIDPELIWDFTCLLDRDALYRESAGDPRVLSHVFEQSLGQAPPLQAGIVFCKTTPVPTVGAAIPAKAVTVTGTPAALTNPPIPVPAGASCTPGTGTTCVSPGSSCLFGCGTCKDTYHLTTGQCDCRCD